MMYALEKKIAWLVAKPQLLVDRIGMYRMVTTSLMSLVIFSLAAGTVGFLAYGLLVQLMSLAIVLLMTLGLNVLLSVVWKVHVNHESAVITALILFFLMIPNETIIGNWQLAAAAALAIASKYFIAHRRQHILNPAAVGAVLLVLIVAGVNMVTGSTYNTDIFSWWIANPTLFWPVFLLGSFIVFKVRKWTPVLAFFSVGLTVFLFEEWRFGVLGFDSISLYFVSFPTLFLAFFMLTEPFTMPPTKKQQACYGALVGVLSSTTLLAPWISMTPELALVIGNCFAYVFRIRQKLYLELLEKKQIAKDTWEFVFKKPTALTFQPGQYLEWMLPHHNPDNRGLRRYFTIASSPTESVMRLACKIVPEKGSSYKAALKEIDAGESIIASQLLGDFLLPKDTTTKLGFIAGGIGVTPFSSQLQHMSDSGQIYDTTLYYCANTTEELAFLSTFEEMASGMPLELIPVIAKEETAAPNETGYVTKEMLTRRTPDYNDRTWYISGPPGMVNAYRSLLRQMGVPRKQIKKDFFPGLA